MLVDFLFFLGLSLRFRDLAFSPGFGATIPIFVLLEADQFPLGIPLGEASNPEPTMSKI